jgi:small subunit ribosomal protein S17e
LDAFKGDNPKFYGMPIKPGYVKKIGNELLERYPEAFTDDYDTNKDSVSKLTNVDSKGVRNRIAGYVTRKKRSRAAA